VEEKRSTMSGVIQCFCFREKRGRGSAYFGRGKEHVRWLLVSTHRVTRGCSGVAVCGGCRLPESDDMWIDPRWKTTNRAS
jgi:hypothetical protein